MKRNTIVAVAVVVLVGYLAIANGSAITNNTTSTTGAQTSTSVVTSSKALMAGIKPVSLIDEQSHPGSGGEVFQLDFSPAPGIDYDISDTNFGSYSFSTSGNVLTLNAPGFTLTYDSSSYMRTFTVTKVGAITQVKGAWANGDVVQWTAYSGPAYWLANGGIAHLGGLSFSGYFVSGDGMYTHGSSISHGVVTWLHSWGSLGGYTQITKTELALYSVSAGTVVDITYFKDTYGDVYAGGSIFWRDTGSFEIIGSSEGASGYTFQFGTNCAGVALSFSTSRGMVSMNVNISPWSGSGCYFQDAGISGTVSSSSQSWSILGTYVEAASR